MNDNSGCLACQSQCEAACQTMNEFENQQQIKPRQIKRKKKFKEVDLKPKRKINLND